MFTDCEDLTRFGFFSCNAVARIWTRSHHREGNVGITNLSRADSQALISNRSQVPGHKRIGTAALSISARGERYRR